MNYHPSLMAGTSHRVEMRKDGGSKGWGWVSPIVDASKGKLRSSAGRMGRAYGKGVGEERRPQGDY